MEKIMRVYYPGDLYCIGKKIDGCGKIVEIVEVEKSGQMAHVRWFHCLNADGEVIVELNAATCESVHIEPEKEK